MKMPGHKHIKGMERRTGLYYRLPPHLGWTNRNRKPEIRSHSSRFPYLTNKFKKDRKHIPFPKVNQICTLPIDYLVLLPTQSTSSTTRKKQKSIFTPSSSACTTKNYMTCLNAWVCKKGEGEDKARLLQNPVISAPIITASCAHYPKQRHKSYPFSTKPDGTLESFDLLILGSLFRKLPEVCPHNLICLETETPQHLPRESRCNSQFPEVLLAMTSSVWEL